jgi:hypothetical protein
LYSSMGCCGCCCIGAPSAHLVGTTHCIAPTNAARAQFSRGINQDSAAAPDPLAGGEDHKTGSLWPYDPYERLIKYAKSRWTEAGEVVHMWNGQVSGQGEAAPAQLRRPQWRGRGCKGCPLLLGGVLASLGLSTARLAADSCWAVHKCMAGLPCP